MTTATHYARAINRYAPHLDALGIDRDELLLELLYRSDGKGDGTPCGGGWISKRKKCSKKGAQKLAASLKAGDKGAIARVQAGKKKARDRQSLGRAVIADKGKKARDIPGIPKGRATGKAKTSATFKEGDRFKMPPTTKERSAHSKTAQRGINFMEARLENMTADNYDNNLALIQKKRNSKSLDDAIYFATEGSPKDRSRALDRQDLIVKAAIDKRESLHKRATELAAKKRDEENRQSLNKERDRSRQMRNKYGMG